MTAGQSTESGRRVIHAISKVLLEMNGQQHDMGKEAFTDEVKRRAELELPGMEIPGDTLLGLTEILMRAGNPKA